MIKSWKEINSGSRLEGDQGIDFNGDGTIQDRVGAPVGSSRGAGRIESGRRSDRVGAPVGSSRGTDRIESRIGSDRNSGPLVLVLFQDQVNEACQQFQILEELIMIIFVTKKGAGYNISILF